MCLIALAIERHPRFPLVIAANRDEFLHRPAAALDWWQTVPDRSARARRPRPAGRRHLDGAGRATAGLAMLTNVRDLPRHDAAGAIARRDRSGLAGDAD